MGAESLPLELFLGENCGRAIDRQGFRDRLHNVERLDADALLGGFRQIISDRAVMDELLSHSIGEMGLKKREKYAGMVMAAGMGVAGKDGLPPV